MSSQLSAGSVESATKQQQQQQTISQLYPHYTESQLKEALDSLLQGSDNPDEDARHIFGYGNRYHKLSTLQTITATRILDVQTRMSDPSAPSEQELLQQAKESWPQQSRLDLQVVIQSQHPRMALAAEFKRASPSKGDIAPHLHAGEQAAVYHKAGASTISILTEPRWFQGSLEDLTQARMATTLSSSRPAILRKDFVVNEYMIAEAAAAGADTILLIVAILPRHVLQRLISYARNVVGMEPLVEVHANDELQVALEAGAKVIGVNNRNLHTFQLDLETSERIATRMIQDKLRFSPSTSGSTSTSDPDDDDLLPPDYTLCALSGMSTALDVDRYRRAGISMCLIGESLMRATDPAAAIRSLCLDPSDFEQYKLQQQPLVSANGQVTSGGGGGAYIGGTKLIKVCGITNVDDALVACRAGANLIGIIFVPQSKRCVTVASAKDIVRAVQAFGERTGPVRDGWDKCCRRHDSTTTAMNPLYHFIESTQTLETATRRRPLVVGVFQNQEASFVKQMVDECELDLVQLHGQEGMAAANIAVCGAPAIRVVDIETDPTTGTSTANAVEGLLAALTCDPIAILLDTSIKGSSGGGTGVTFDWNVAAKVQASGLPVMIAGGLDPNNIQDAVGTIRPWGVDVSSGVEAHAGKKDHAKVQEFVRDARTAALESNKGF